MHHLSHNISYSMKDRSSHLELQAVGDRTIRVLAPVIKGKHVYEVSYFETHKYGSMDPIHKLTFESDNVQGVVALLDGAAKSVSIHGRPHLTLKLFVAGHLQTYPAESERGLPERLAPGEEDTLGEWYLPGGPHRDVQVSKDVSVMGSQGLSYIETLTSVVTALLADPS